MKPSIQEALFEQIASRLPANLSLADAIKDALDIGDTSAYRRLSGETALKIDEVEVLCQKFAISFDALVLNTQGRRPLLFQALGIRDQEATIDNYLRSIHGMINSFRGGSKYIYAAKDVPVFHIFQYPELTAFKIFFWRRSQFDDPTLRHKPFRLQEAMQDMASELAICHDIALAYAQFPVVEIWNLETTSSYFKQLNYYLESQLIATREDAHVLADKLEEMFRHIQDEATVGHKHMPNSNTLLGSYSLYKNELVVIDNAIHVSLPGKSLVISTFNLINYLSTDDQVFCGEVEHWLNRLIQKSDHISQIAEKERFRFFSSIQRKVDTLRRDIDRLLE
jgi:hypothetical protein